MLLTDQRGRVPALWALDAAVETAAGDSLYRRRARWPYAVEDWRIPVGDQIIGGFRIPIRSGGPGPFST